MEFYETHLVEQACSWDEALVGYRHQSWCLVGMHCSLNLQSLMQVINRQRSVRVLPRP